MPFVTSLSSPLFYLHRCERSARFSCGESRVSFEGSRPRAVGRGPRICVVATSHASPRPRKFGEGGGGWAMSSKLSEKNRVSRSSAACSRSSRQNYKSGTKQTKTPRTPCIYAVLFNTARAPSKMKTHPFHFVNRRKGGLTGSARRSSRRSARRRPRLHSEGPLQGSDTTTWR